MPQRVSQDSVGGHIAVVFTQGTDRILGPTITSGLAHAGLSSFLKLYTTDRHAFKTEVSRVQARMVEELQTNSAQQIGRKYPQRAGELAARDSSSLFPTYALDSYLQPCTSPLQDLTLGWPGFGRGAESSKLGRSRNDGRGDLEGRAKACEKYFEWGTRELVTRKFAGESVGLFGAEIMNEARERVRSAYAQRSTSSIVSRSSGEEATAPPRITSFFASTAPSASIPSKTFSPTHDSSQEIPPHVLKIHSVRDDPTNPALREFRVSFKHDIYAARCRAAMEGTRVDPNDLPIAERRTLGLVERDDGEEEANMPATQARGSSASKTEIRVWISDYLVREAWPTLIEVYESELRTKAAAKIRVPRKVITTSRTTRRAKVAAGENREAFVGFFSQRPRESSPFEEVEQIEERRPARCSKSVIDLCLSPSPRPSTRRQKPPSVSDFAEKLVRPCPSSSLPSAVSDGTTMDLVRTSHVAASSSPAPPVRARTRIKTIRIISSPSSPVPRLVRAVSTVAKSKSSSKGDRADPIDLCSSDEALSQSPRSSQRFVRRPPPSSQGSNFKTSMLSSTSVSAPSTRISRKAVSNDVSQSRLDLSVVAVGSTRLSSQDKTRSFG